MPGENDKIKKLYDTFVSDGYDMESEEDFRKNLSDSTKRKAAYDALVNDGYDMEPFEDFEKNIGFGNKIEYLLKEPVFERDSSKVYSQIAQQHVLQANSAIKQTEEQIDKQAPVSTPANVSVNGKLRQAVKERDEISSMLAARGEELRKEYEDKSIFQKILTGIQHAEGGYHDNALETTKDDKYMKLSAALRQKNEQIAELENQKAREQGDSGFWRSFGKTVADPYTWLQAPKIADAVAMAGAKSGASEEDDILLQSTFENQQTQAEYAGNADFWERAGMMTGHMPAFMIDFMATGGGFKGMNALSKLGTKLATKAVGKEVAEQVAKDGILSYIKNNGVKGLGRFATDWTIKALGTTADDLLIRAPLMTNTVQAASTASDIIERKLGNVEQNEDGTYSFGNDKGLGDAIWQGEANAIIENYSEMFGAHLDPVLSLKNVAKLADVIGAKKIGKVLAKASASELGGIMGKTNELFNQMGVSDYFGEVSEEYYGQLWRTMLNLDDAYQQNADGTRTNLFNTGQFHGDILGGMALSMGMMGAGKTSVTAINYASMKHGVNKADARASEILGKDTWEQMKETIDLTTNEEIGDIAVGIVNDKDLSNEGKAAALDYLERSMKFRGFNLATVAQKRSEKVDEASEELNESYMDGYNAVEQQEMNDAKNMYDYQRERMKEELGVNDGALDDDVVDWMNELKNAIDSGTELGRKRAEVILDFLNAKAVKDGMMQRVRDDIDSRVGQSNAIINSRVNKSTGMIQGATMKNNDRKVYVVAGNVKQYDDKSGVDNNASDKTIIIKDAETGKFEQVSPESIFNVDDTIDPEQEKLTAAEAIRQQFAQEAANKIDGVVAFNPGDKYTITGDDGQAEVTVVANEQGIVDNGDGTINVTRDGKEVFPLSKDVIQQQVDEANRARVRQFDEERRVKNGESNAAMVEMNDQITFLDEGGNEVSGVVQSVGDDGVVVEVGGTDADLGKPTQFKAEDLYGRLTSISRGGNVMWQKEAEENREATEQPNKEQPPMNSASSKVPTDEQGRLVYEEAEPGIAWDALVEQTGGEEDIAAEIANDIIKEQEQALKNAEKELKKLQESKPKASGKPMSIEERIAAKKAEKVALEEAQKRIDTANQNIAKWKQIADTKALRQREAEAAEEKAAALKAEQEKAEQMEREVLNGVPDIVDDTPQAGEIKATSMFQYFTGTLSELIAQAKQSAQGLIKKVIAPISSRLKNDLNSQGLQIDDDYNHVIDNNAIRHTLKKHSGKNEEKRGQIPITDADFENIADVVEHYDGVEVVSGNTSAQRIIYHKSYQDGTVIFVEEQRVGRKELAAVTMWKKKNPNLTDANRTETTLISDLTEVSDNKDTNNSIKSSELGEKIAKAEAEVDVNPTDKQKEAGNYKKGHVQVGVFDITIEQPKGSVRSGVDANGNKWETTMQNTYGYIRGTEGVDGDHIDVFLSDDIDGWNGRRVFVVDQYNEDGSFDEHKVMLGFNETDDAEAAYFANYDNDWAKKHKTVVTGVNLEDFEKWIDSSHRKTKAFAEYKSVKSVEEQSSSTQVNRLSEIKSRIEELHKEQEAAHGQSDIFEEARIISEINDLFTEQRKLEQNNSNEETTTPTDAAYTITPAQYTTKRGKVLDMHLVKFNDELRDTVRKHTTMFAKQLKGWWDKEKQGFMMRSKEDAERLAEYATDAQLQQPVSMSDMQALNDGNVQFVEPQLSETSKPEERQEYTPVWQYSVSVDKKTGLTTLRRDDVSGPIPIGDGRFNYTANSPEEMLEIVRNPKNFNQELRDAVETILENKVYEEVQRFDVANFDKSTIDAIATAEAVAREAEVEQEAEVAKHRIKKTQAASKKIDKKTVNSQQSNELDLFDGLIDNNKNREHGLQRTDAERSERVPANGNRHEQGLSRGTETGSESEQQAGRGTDSEGERPGDAVDRTVRPRLSDSVEEKKNTRNNHSERGKDHAPTSVDARIEANIKAIELAKQLLENGEQATEKQMQTLRKFSGWGGLGKAFSEGTYYAPNPTQKKLRELLGEKAYQEAVMSANSAYYTPAYVVDTLWDIAEKMGFDGGNILEGSAGIGNILGQMPVHISEQSDIHAIEIDGTSGEILSLLYPDAKVDIQGFEQTRIPNGSVDLAITNVPFVTGLRVNDTTGDKDLSKKFHNIHDFCIAKNVRKLREGGLGIFITSNGTLDNSKKLRDWIVNEGGADFVGAFRMHNKTFGGTGVTSDIIVIRKRVNGQKSAHAIDVSDVSGERMAEYDTGETRKVKGKEMPVIKQLSMDYNRYFIEHPENMAGEMHFAFEKGDTFRPTSKGLYPKQDKKQEEMLAEFVRSFRAEEFGDRNTEVITDAMPGKKIGEVFVKDGKLYINSTASAQSLDVNANKVKGHTKVECFEAYTAIKEALAEVLSYQTENESDEGLKPLLDKLNKAYDDFVSTYGHFNKNTAIAFLRNDVDYANVSSVETYEEIGDGKGGIKQTFGKADIMNGRVVEKEKEPTPTNVKDGIIASIFKFGRVDIPYIAEQLSTGIEDVKKEIIENGYGFENPISRQIEASYQYLSGNIREKLRQAEANNENGEFDRNIKALQEVMPMEIPAHLIDFTLGSSWIDPKLYEDFVKERTEVDVRFTAVGGTWFMKEPYFTNYEKNRAIGVTSEMLGRTIMGHTLIEAAIQNRSITVSTTRKNWDGSTETITDKEATQACAAKIDEIRQDFKDWARQKMQSDPEMSERMERIYNDMFNNFVPMSIPDEFVPEYFGGASHKFKMRLHQGRAIVRGTQQPLLLAHEVGTGKTFTLISTAMEMRRLGTARKPMIVVQNATVGQFVASAKELYPNAKILTLEEADRSAEGRKNFYAKIRYNDWDMIVVPQSTFEFIPDSEEREMAFVQDKIEEKMLILEKMKEEDPDGKNMITRQAEREIELLEEQLAGLADNASKKRTANDDKKRAVALQNAEVKAMEMLDRRTDDVENFDDMGIDALLVDEAHEYKHLGFATAMQRGVKGVDPSYSKKSQGVFLKTQAVLEKNNGRNVIFATGTPISNTAAEIWAFMRYLMPADTMKEYGIYYFDDFVRNFGNIQQMLEFTTSGKFKENNRFAGYVNLPELVRIWSGVSDTVLTKEAGGVKDKIPEMEGGKAQDLYLPQTRALRSIMKFVKSELEHYEQMSGKEKKENSHIPLTMYGIAKAAAVDARLVQSDAEDDQNSKTNEAVRQTLRSLKETADYKGTVAIFADNYQNKQSGFNLYDDIRNKLIAEGVPADEIVVMRSGMTVKKKLEIFEKVNRGEVRVILGSTFTLGTGVNIQERLHTLIHLDAPNRPMDYTQRNGRILRQGNLHKDMNKPVRILRFGVEDSLDVTAYQRLKTKGAIADSIMNGRQMMNNSMTNRVLEEEEDVFGDTVAQLSGSEYAMLKNNAEKNVRKYASRKKQWETDQAYIHNAKPRLKAFIKDAEKRIEDNGKYLEAVRSSFPDGQFKEILIGKHRFTSVDTMDDFFKEHNKSVLAEMKQIKDGEISGEQKRELSIQIGDFSFVITTKLTRQTMRDGATLFNDVERKMTYSCPELGIENVPVRQNLLRNAIEDITSNVITGKNFAERLSAGERSKKHNEAELKELLSREGKPFEFEKELEQAKSQLEEYAELMKKELEEKEAKYAEMDAGVEAANDITNADEDDVLYRSDDTKDLIEDLFHAAVSGEFKGRPISIGTLTDDGKAYLEKISGITFKDRVNFVLNPSDLVHIYKGHFGNNETDERSIPLNIDDIRNIADVVSFPDKIIYAKERNGQKRNMFFFLKEASDGAYNLLEIYSDGRGNLTAKTFYKTKEGVSQRVITLNKSLHTTSETDRATLFSNAKIPQMFENPTVDGDNLREGDGVYTDDELSYENDPVAKLLGRSRRTAKQRREFAQRERQRMVDKVESLAEKLHLDNVEIVTDASTLEGEKQRAKGFYSKSTGKITIVVPNHASVFDIEQTLLHEAVAHYGLRKLFGSHFDTFLDNVFNNAEESIRRHIVDMAVIKYGWDFRKATEEYLAGLAERTDFNDINASWWRQIKKFFLDMLHKIGFEDFRVTTLTDNELRYILWRSYKNLTDPGMYRSILGEAEDIAKQYELKVGNYAEKGVVTEDRVADVELSRATNIVKNFENPDLKEINNSEEEELFRDGDPVDDAHAIYEEAVKDTGEACMAEAIIRSIKDKDIRKRFKNKFAESYFDYSRSVKALQDAIAKATGKAIQSFENAWQALNAKSSVDSIELQRVKALYIDPLNEHIGKMIKDKKLYDKKLNIDDVEIYLNAKHGPERNHRMADEDAEQRAIDKNGGFMEKPIDTESEDYQDRLDKWEEWRKDVDKEKERLLEKRRDYSGLTALFEKQVEDKRDVEELEDAARDYCEAFETVVGKDMADELHRLVKALNEWSLKKAYMSGLLSNEQYNRVNGMYDYYVPLRGWHDNYAGDVYEYISNGADTSTLQSVMRHAYGRKSRAGHILGTMASMANLAIVQGNKNLVAQKFMNCALNHNDSGLLMASKQWYERTKDGDMVPVYPDFISGNPEHVRNISAEEMQESIERYDAEMQARSKTDTKLVSSKFSKEFPHKMAKWQENQHSVRVMRNGVEYRVYVLGNPKAAQALNGLLNPDSKVGIIGKYMMKWLRFRAQMQTSFSPFFLVGNFQRDIVTAGTSMYIKHGAKIGRQFANHLCKLMPVGSLTKDGDTLKGAGIFTLIRRYDKGSLDMTDEMQRYFKEFCDNGGITGISSITKNEEFENQLKDVVRRIRHKNLNMPRDAAEKFFGCVEFLNKGIENATRFSVYMTMRQAGKSVGDAVFEAKDASVNFNMKGSGAWLNLWMRRYILYSNVALQALYKLGNLYDANPKRFYIAMSTPMLVSFATAMLCHLIGGDDDDDEGKWYGLSQWNRYNYINIPTGKGYLHYSIPQEFRPSWALGQIIYDWQADRITKEAALQSMLTQLNNISPMAFIAGGVDSGDDYIDGFVKAWTPTIAADFMDVYHWNQDFLGRSITNQREWNKTEPEWQRAGKDTPQWAIEMSKMWSDATGGRAHWRSSLDNKYINPSALYYLFKQQLGGVGEFITKTSNMIEQIQDPETELELRNIPFVSKFYVETGDDVSKNRVTNDKFRMYWSEFKAIDSEIRKNRSDYKNGKITEEELKVRDSVLTETGDMSRWNTLISYSRLYDQLIKESRDGSEKAKKELQNLKRSVVKLLEDGENERK